VTEAAEQCARTALPELAEPVKLDALLRTGRRGARCSSPTRPGAPDAASLCRSSRPAALLVGPEGGFDDAEREAIRAHPARPCHSLGPRILRAETAAIAATALWMAWRQWRLGEMRIVAQRKLSLSGAPID
jgi:16S rRNA (uracil1498-N3)-methyltransferase